MYDLQLGKLCYKIQREPVPHYFDSVIPILTHHYNTRQDTLQQHRTIHLFADQNCIHVIIALINKHPIIKLNWFIQNVPNRNYFYATFNTFFNMSHAFIVVDSPG